MALSVVAGSAWVTSVSAVTPTAPTGLAIGDLVVLTLVSKYDDAVLPSDPAGWTTPGTPAVTSGRTAGNDNGNLRMRVFYRIWESGDTMPSLAPTPNNVSAVCAVAYRATTGGYDVIAQPLADSTAGTPVEVTTAATSLAVDDHLLTAMVINGDLPTWGATTVTASGITFGSITSPVADASTTTGADLRMRVMNRIVTAGTASPTITCSTVVSGTTTNVVGVVNVLRVREAAAAYSRTATMTGAPAITAAGTLALSASATLAGAPSVTAAGATDLSATATLSGSPALTCAGTVNTGGPTPNPQLVQQISANTGTSSLTHTLTFGATCTVGNLIVVGLSVDKNGGTITIAGSGWTALPGGPWPSTSVSMAVWWKVSDGTETSVTADWTTNNVAGGQMWAGEYVDNGNPSGVWTLVGNAANATDESVTATWSTGTTGATTSAGTALAFWACDSMGSVDPSPSNGYAERYDGFASGSGRASLVVGELTGLSSGSTTSSSITRTADQQSGAVGVWAKVGGGGTYNGTASRAGTATLTSAGTVELLGVPGNFTATPVSTTQVNLAWDTVTGATGYDVERNSSIIASPTSNSYNDTGLTENTQYSYRVRATKT